MDPKLQLFFGIIALFIGLAILFWFVLGGSAVSHRQVMSNLRRDTEEPSPTGLPGDRELSPLDQVIQRQTPPALVRQMAKLWAGAGRPEKWPVERLLATKYLLGLVGIAVAIGAVVLNPSTTGVLLGIGLALLLFFLPELRLYSRSLERREAIALQLPDILDQMSIAVKAGLGFDAAMARVARTGRGELPEELVRTMQDIQVGQSRRAAYADLSARTGVDSLHQFTRSIIQAEAYGIALSDVLETQADELRMERRQTAERRAMEIPVKVVFPLILFILPAIFIVVMGPGAIQIMESFGVRF
ncbi:tight adherence protein C [Propionicimonas paludicola]|uniref:Tight adherence protein C n=1 Tax=Propionicimonas paludicola TaxID=185243 RepID=A0A2A9CVX5_9ACTN|nr:type II secretion system F family protein [Propionicimonas paludicola]PFG18296.1 tight adherence protein C [Propionicimonas paludicola]